MSSLYEKIVTKKQLDLLDICETESFVENLFSNKVEAVTGVSQIHKFPFTESFKEVYRAVTVEMFEREKERIIHTILEHDEEDQIFESEIGLMGDVGHIRYLFSIPYAEAYINQSKINSSTLDVETLYQYTQLVEIDSQHKLENNNPVIVFEYIYSAPGFFVIDGNHRIIESIKKGKSSIEGYVLSENTSLFLFPSPFFNLLMTIHRNLVIIGLYMIGEVDYETLKLEYVRIGEEQLH